MNSGKQGCLSSIVTSGCPTEADLEGNFQRQVEVIDVNDFRGTSTPRLDSGLGSTSPLVYSTGVCESGVSEQERAQQGLQASLLQVQTPCQFVEPPREFFETFEKDGMTYYGMAAVEKRQMASAQQYYGRREGVMGYSSGEAVRGVPAQVCEGVAQRVDVQVGSVMQPCQQVQICAVPQPPAAYAQQQPYAARQETILTGAPMVYSQALSSSSSQYLQGQGVTSMGIIPAGGSGGQMSGATQAGQQSAYCAFPTAVPAQQANLGTRSFGYTMGMGAIRAMNGGSMGPMGVAVAPSTHPSCLAGGVQGSTFSGPGVLQSVRSSSMQFAGVQPPSGTHLQMSQSGTTVYSGPIPMPTGGAGLPDQSQVGAVPYGRPPMLTQDRFQFSRDTGEQYDGCSRAILLDSPTASSVQFERGNAVPVGYSTSSGPLGAMEAGGHVVRGFPQMPAATLSSTAIGVRPLGLAAPVQRQTSTTAIPSMLQQSAATQHSIPPLPLRGQGPGPQQFTASVSGFGPPSGVSMPPPPHVSPSAFGSAPAFFVVPTDTSSTYIGGGAVPPTVCAGPQQQSGPMVQSKGLQREQHVSRWVPAEGGTTTATGPSTEFTRGMQQMQFRPLIAQAVQLSQPLVVPRQGSGLFRPPDQFPASVMAYRGATSLSFEPMRVISPDGYTNQPTRVCSSVGAGTAAPLTNDGDLSRNFRRPTHLKLRDDLCSATFDAAQSVGEEFVDDDALVNGSADGIHMFSTDTPVSFQEDGEETQHVVQSIQEVMKDGDEEDDVVMGICGATRSHLLEFRNSSTAALFDSVTPEAAMHELRLNETNDVRISTSRTVTPTEFRPIEENSAIRSTPMRMDVTTCPVAPPKLSDDEGSGTTECEYCRYLKKPSEYYQSHRLRDARGVATCPLLRATECAVCKATGDNAHGVQFCDRAPENVRVVSTNRCVPSNDVRMSRADGPRTIGVPSTERARSLRLGSSSSSQHRDPANAFNRRRGGGRNWNTASSGSGQGMQLGDKASWRVVG